MGLIRWVLNASTIGAVNKDSKKQRVAKAQLAELRKLQGLPDPVEERQAARAREREALRERARAERERKAAGG